MKITVLRKTEYKGCPVYIIRFGTVFQYIFYFKGDIYQNHIFLTPRPLPRLLYFFHLIKDDALYTKDELDEGETMILNGAITTLDKITEKVA